VARERVNPPDPADGTRQRRRRTTTTAEVELSPEELRALADEGVDPAEVQAAARAPKPQDEVSEHDRDTARDEIEGLREDDGYA
jgi:hypothetical protein